MILADLPRNIMLNNDELEFEEAPEFLLGNYLCYIWNNNKKEEDAIFSSWFRK